MLKFSRAINQGKPLDDDLRDEISSDDILRRRFKKKTPNKFLEEFDEEYEPKHTKKSNIYLKEDLINVKLEEKQSLAKKIFSKMKEREKEENKKTKKIFSFGRKKINEIKNIQTKPKIQTKNDQNPIQDKKEKKESIKSIEKIQKTEPKIQNSQTIEKRPDIKKQLDIKQSLENLQKKITPQENKQELPKPSNQDQEKQQNDEDTQKAKNVLLEGFSNATKEDRNLNFNHLLFAALLVSFALFLFAPQIYIRNQIYYLSREIATLRTEESVLNEENKDLKRRLENMRFQNQILDYLE
ncbi:Arginine/ornithine antiporter ArcD [Campylobacter jejuni]|nr:Arginine/ornithine antiporter ArcD [Campylobacter jejuni]